MVLRAGRAEGPPSSAQAANTMGKGKQESDGVGTRVLRWVKRPEFVTDLLLVGKAVVAGTVAWAIATFVLESQIAFMAPWTALLTVQATVHRSLSRGAQTTISSAVGLGLSFIIVTFLGVNVFTFALALFVGLLGARISWLRYEGVAIATTAIFVLTAEQPMFMDRSIELILGVVVGIAVNLLIIPPLRDQQASRYVDSINRRMGAVLINIADEFSDNWDTDRSEAWLKETNSMTSEVNSAWQMVRFARESQQNNPRLRFGHRRRAGQQPQVWSQDVSYEEILGRVDEGISHLRNLTRTLREASYAQGDWDQSFREGWVALTRDVGRAIADPEATVEDHFDRLNQLTARMSETDQDLPRTDWPTYGTLLASLRHIMVIIDDVASAREARETSEKLKA